MSDADLYDLPNISPEERAHFFEMQRRAAQWAAQPPGKVSVTPTAPRPGGELDSFRFPGEDESTAELLARQAAYNRAQRDGLIKVFRK